MKKVDLLIVSYAGLPLPQRASYQTANLLKNGNSMFFILISGCFRGKLDLCLNHYFPREGGMAFG